MAFLTPYPNTFGAAVVITKEHHSSYVLAAEESIYTGLLLFAREMGRRIDVGLKVQRTALVAEGYGVNHLHVKLFPMHGVPEGEWRPILSQARDFYERYPGFISSNEGPRMSDGELRRIARAIRDEVATDRDGKIS